ANPLKTSLPTAGRNLHNPSTFATWRISAQARYFLRLTHCVAISLSPFARSNYRKHTGPLAVVSGVWTVATAAGGVREPGTVGVTQMNVRRIKNCLMAGLCASLLGMVATNAQAQHGRLLGHGGGSSGGDCCGAGAGAVAGGMGAAGAGAGA